MTLIDHFMKVRKNSRANSEKQYENGSDDEFEELYRLKILVNED